MSAQKMSFRKSIVTAALAAIVLLPASASAGTKEQLIQLQTQVQSLQDQMSQMKQSFDERMGIMRNLVEQTTDSVNKLNATIGDVNKNLQQQTGDSAAKTDQVSTQVQALQDSLDELKQRLAKVSKQLDDMQSAQQNLNAQPAGSGTPGAPAVPQQQAPPPDVLYNNGLRDYNAGKFDLAQQEFSDYLKFYPTTDLAGNAQFYLADIIYRSGNYQQAVTEYDKVLEQYPGGNKTPAAQLKKGMALEQLGQNEAAVSEFRSLRARYPRTQEAAVALEQLRKLGASPTAGKPSAARRRPR